MAITGDDPPFKAGDRVRLISSYSGFEDLRGMVLTVIRCYRNSHGEFLFDARPRLGTADCAIFCWRAESISRPVVRSRRRRIITIRRH